MNSGGPGIAGWSDLGVSVWIWGPTRPHIRHLACNFDFLWSAANGSLRDGGLRNPRISEEKHLFPPFSGFRRCSSHPPEKGEKGRKRAKKADFGRFQEGRPVTP